MSIKQADIQATLSEVDRQIEFTKRLISVYDVSRQAYSAKLIELIRKQEHAARHDQTKCNADGIEP